MTFGDQLRATRKKLGLTQAKAASIVSSCPLRTWEDYEAGRRNPTRWQQVLIFGRLALATGTEPPTGWTQDGCLTAEEATEYAAQESSKTSLKPQQ